ncbi:hypothetical protein ACF09C_15320 [Streptomyces sp. NPDC014870]|uniref:hypothetical protein n=1 Tax=Streptomyces sp. NPDC014870 TaxID=3364925 RepID=UPI0036F4F42C
MTTTPGAGWAGTVRERLGPGRLLPLGEAADGAWLAERAARTVLLRAAGAVPGVVPGPLRVGLGVAGAGAAVAVAPLPVPPGGLPPGMLRITGEFTARARRIGERPLPELAEDVRAALFAAAERDLGLLVEAVDLRVTGLVEDGPDSATATPPPGRIPPPKAEDDDAEDLTAEAGTVEGSAAEDPVAVAVLGVPGVAGLTSVLGAPVHRSPGALRVELAVAAGHRALDVARAARTRAAGAAPGATAVTVLVADVR